ncbi:AB hydrolase-1 domain-containing protein [Citrus sinensis]|nr:AB hydrolase-1 domain-containing protein [Citrus sinensis]
MEGIQHRIVKVNGINMHVAEKGQGPVILFLHGFPELWYSWRHQITALASLGYRAVAPDLRGYTCFHGIADLVGLIDIVAPNDEKMFVVGHDWGAFMAWFLCLFRPDRVKALVNMSVTFDHFDPNTSVSNNKRIEALRAYYGDDYYMCRFQKPGEIEAEFAQIGIETIIKEFFTFWTPGLIILPKGKRFGHPPDVPIALPSWFSEEDVKYFTTNFDKKGFTGGINY